MLSTPVGVVTDLDGTVVFDGVADPRLAPFLRRAAGREDISVIVATPSKTTVPSRSASTVLSCA